MSRRLALLGALLLASPAAAAEPELHGFVEGATAARVDGGGYALQEARLGLRGDVWGDRAEARFGVDFVSDAVVGDGDPRTELREAWLRAPLGDRFRLQAGRQPATWGTGDLLFINDLFPKDYVSFFTGRADPYLKLPVDALRLSGELGGNSVDLLWMPYFQPDELPRGERLRAHFLVPGLPVDEPAREAGEGEWALRLSRWYGSTALALYGYHGRWKAPLGLRTGSGGGPEALYHPALSVAGASARGTLAGGVAWAEGGYHHSHDDEGGDDPFVPNHELRGLAGYERSWWTDGTLGVQAYHERRLDHAGPEATGDRSLLTLRLRQLARGQTVELGLFGFWSPDDGDAHLRLHTGVDLTDEVELVVGALVFADGEGTGPEALFGAAEADDAAFGRVRFSF